MKRMFFAKATVVAATALMGVAGLSACGNQQPATPEQPTKVTKEAPLPTKPKPPAKEVKETPAPQPDATTVKCEGYTPKDEDDWAMPKWNNSCQFTNDVLALFSDAGGFKGTGTYGGEVIPVVKLNADAEAIDCGGVPLDGKTIFTSMWCGQDSGHIVIFDEAMTNRAEPQGEFDSVGAAHIFGDLLKDYSQRRLELGGKYDQFSDVNVACTSGAVMALLVDKGTVTAEQAEVIGDLSFTDDENPEVRSTYSKGLAGTC